MDMNAVLEIVTRSEPGMVRSNNEDAVMANPKSGFAVLADGMGGYNAGEVASGMATALLGTELEKAFAEREPSNQGCLLEGPLRKWSSKPKWLASMAPFTKRRKASPSTREWVRRWSSAFFTTTR